MPAKKSGHRELKIALLAALPFGAAAALILNWTRLFPVPPEKLVEVAWKHDCTCASAWMQSLRNEGFEVRDFEMNDLRLKRQQWHVPRALDSCHPASFMGYFVDGHISANDLRRLARERPDAIGIQRVDTVKRDERDKPKIVSSQLMLIDRNGAAKPWPQ